VWNENNAVIEGAVSSEYEEEDKHAMHKVFN
jgi:hypothetical protein